MSKLLSISDLAYTRKLWAEAHPALGVRERGVWLLDWESAMEPLKYVQGLRCHAQYDHDCMIVVRAQVSLASGNLEAVMADLTNIWSTDLASGLKAIHSFRQTPDVLDMLFACLTPSAAYLTGTVSLAVRS